MRNESTANYKTNPIFLRIAERKFKKSFQPKSALAGVCPVFADAVRFVHAYIARASEHFYYRAERPIWALRRAYDTELFRSPQGTGRVCPNVFSPHSDGSPTLGRHYADDWPALF